MFTLGKQSFWNKVTPGAAMRDFVLLWRENPYRWRVLAISIVLSGTMFYGFLPKNVRALPEKAEITYISTFAPDRTDDEIVASNIENQRIKEQDEALLAERVEARKEFYRKLGRASGFDVDALERQYSDKPSDTAQTATRADKP